MLRGKSSENSSGTVPYAKQFCEIALTNKNSKHIHGNLFDGLF